MADGSFTFSKWLASRYHRPALPTEFNNRIHNADKKGKIRKTSKKLGSSLSGLYLQINPEEEISAHENYEVLLLGLIPDSFNGHNSVIYDHINAIGEVFDAAGFVYRVAVVNESEVSVATLRSYNRFNFDYLSYDQASELPM